MSDIPAGLTLDPGPASIPAGLTLDNETTSEAPMIGNHPAFGFYDQRKPDAAAKGVYNVSPIGRVLDAFGQGARDGWGAAPLGLDAETEDGLRKAGIITDPTHPGGVLDVFKAFNEGLIRPAAALVHTVLRGGSSVIDASGSAAGAVADESGLTKAIGAPEGSAQSDWKGMAETIATVLGARVPELPEATFARANELGVLREAPSEIPSRGPIIPDATEPFEAKPAIATASNVAPDTISKPITPATDKAGNIRLDLINSEHDLDQIFRDAAAANSDFMPERRGVVSLENSKATADALGIPADYLLKRATGQALNDSELWVARTAAVQSAETVRELAQKAQFGTAADQAALLEAVERHYLIQGKFSGALAEAGRALNIIKEMGQDRANLSALDEVVKRYGGRDKVDDLARAIASQETPQGVSKFLHEARTPTGFDKLQEGWLSGLLSGPKTHAANLIGNFSMMAHDLTETAVAEGIGRIRAIVGDTSPRVTPGETAARAYAIAGGARDGVKAAAKAWNEELPLDDLQKWRGSPRAAIGGSVGRYVRVPLRALSAADEFFKTIARHQELRAQAWRQAYNEGSRGDALSVRANQLLDAPTDEMKAAADKHADYLTFTSELGAAGKKVTELANTPVNIFGMEARPGKFIVPFFRTPVNLTKRGLERTVLGALNRDLYQTADPIARDMALSRLAIASGATTAVVTLVANGDLTGSLPADRKERAYWYAIGRQPYSVKIGDTWYSYSRVEPLATILGVTADAYRTIRNADDEDASEVLGQLLSGFVNTTLNKASLTGLSDVISAVQDYDRYGKRYVTRLLSTVVPAGVAQVAQTIDPNLRRAKGLLQTIESRVPGLTENVPLRRDVWGEPVVRGGSFGPDLISPIYESREVRDPVANALHDVGIFPSELAQRIRGVTLTPEEYDDYQRIAGRLTRQALTSFVQMDGYDDVPAALRKRALPKFIDRAREQARVQMLLTHPRIIQEATRLRVKDYGGE